MTATILTTVIALEAVFGHVPSAAEQADFQRVLATVARQFGTPVAEGVVGNCLQLTIVLTPEAPAAAALRRLSAAMDELLPLHADVILRVLAHHGVVFVTEAAGRSTYMGSAIRSVQNIVRKLEDLDGLFATKDFVAHVATWAQSPVRFDEVRGIEGLDGLSEIRFDAAFVLPSATPDALAVNNPAFVHFIKRRLADDIGPFAGALVDAARRSAPTAAHLVKEVSAEIDDAAARKLFEQEAEAFLKSSH